MITVLAPAITILILTGLSWKKFLPEWIQEVPGKTQGWRNSLVIGAILGIGSAFAMNHFMDTIQPYDFRIYTLAILIWLTPLVCLTDFSLYKISAPVSTSVIVALLPNLAYMAIIDITLLWTALLLMILPILLFFFVMGLGTGDIKLIAMFALGLNWMTLKEWGWGFIGMAAVSILGAIIILIRGDKLKHIDVEDNLVKQAIDNAKNEKENSLLAKEEPQEALPPVRKSVLASDHTKKTGISLSVNIDFDLDDTEPVSHVLQKDLPPEAETPEAILANISDEDGKEAYRKSLDNANRKIAVEKFVSETSKEISKQFSTEGNAHGDLAHDEEEEEEIIDDDKVISDYFKNQEKSLKAIAKKEEDEKTAKSKKRKKYATPAGPGFLIGFILIGVYYIYKFGEFIPSSFIDMQ